MTILRPNPLQDAFYSQWSALLSRGLLATVLISPSFLGLLVTLVFLLETSVISPPSDRNFLICLLSFERMLSLAVFTVVSLAQARGRTACEPCLMRAPVGLASSV